MSVANTLFTFVLVSIATAILIYMSRICEFINIKVAAFGTRKVDKAVSGNVNNYKGPKAEIEKEKAEYIRVRDNFIDENPGYGYGGRIDKMRCTEFSRLNGMH